MKTFVLLAAALAATASPTYQLDLERYYYPTPAAELADRAQLLADVDAFVKRPVAALDSPEALSHWLADYDALAKRLDKHDNYVYLRAEEDSDDRDDAAADETLSIASDHLDDAVQNTLADIGNAKLQGFLSAEPKLAPYGYFIHSALAGVSHTRPAEQAEALLATPALDSLSKSYSQLRRKVLAAHTAVKGATGKDAFDARWKPFLGDEDAFAAVLVPVVSLHNGMAKLGGFSGGPEAKYFSLSLTPTEVDALVTAAQKSDAYRRYISVVGAAAAQKLHVTPAALHTWDLDAADSFKPALIPFPDAVPMILAAEQPMGAEYADEFSKLFDPANARVEWCHTEKCDQTGFSADPIGLPTALYYGSYIGDTNSIRATAHESGHAVHGQFRHMGQTLAVYDRGPNFMGESFAIFNEYLMLEHLYQTASTPEARAFYLNKFLGQVVFEVWGSAEETELEQSIYAGVASGKLRSAADLDALTLKVLARYTPAPALDPALKVYWARDGLFYTDPLYDVNYLYAGLLALEYLHQFHQDPKGFPARYVALLKNGFTDTPQVLEKKFLGIDMDDADGLVRDASDLVISQSALLKSLYAVCGKTPCPTP